VTIAVFLKVNSLQSQQAYKLLILPQMSSARTTCKNCERVRRGQGSRRYMTFILLDQIQSYYHLILWTPILSIELFLYVLT
jgi:hypothetical protein